MPTVDGQYFRSELILNDYATLRPCQQELPLPPNFNVGGVYKRCAGPPRKKQLPDNIEIGGRGRPRFHFEARKLPMYRMAKTADLYYENIVHLRLLSLSQASFSKCSHIKKNTKAPAPSLNNHNQKKTKKQPEQPLLRNN